MSSKLFLLPSRSAWISGFCSLLMSLMASTAIAGPLVFPTDCLPPQGKYLERGPINYGPVFITEILHFGFIGPCMSPPQSGGPPLDETFQSTVTGRINGTQPFSATATVRVLVSFDQAVGNTRFFETEMLQLDLVGLPGAIIRESPTLQSLGETAIMDLSGVGNGPFRIDSFFDVFTELSLDGGNTWLPADRPGRVKLVAVPATLPLLMLGLFLIGMRLRQRSGY